MKLLSRILGRSPKPEKEADRLPIFILGVPRSGTTLLRAILDSHPAIACGPETPWLGAHQPSSVMALQQFLSENPLGYCRSFGMPRAVVTQAARQFVMTLMDEYARSKGKRRWAEKTPDNLMHLEFLREMFPHAAFIHLVRDALDTAISTSIISPHRCGISDWHERFLLIGPECKLENNLFNALLRWNHWNRRVDEVLAGHRLLRVSYERLVCEPRDVLQSVFDFIEEPFDASVLDYARFKHDLPDWEWGSADVKRFDGITKERTGRAEKELSAVERELLLPLAQYGRQEGDLFSGEVQAAIASGGDIDDDRFKLLAEYFDSFARSTGLALLEGSKMWEYPWLWLHVLQNIDWRKKKLVFLDIATAPIPWILALLGAEVTVVASSTELVPRLTELRDRLKVRMDWRQANPPSIPMPAESIDVLVGTANELHSIDKRLLGAEAARVLKYHGTLALTFDHAENRELLTLGEFEKSFQFDPVKSVTCPNRSMYLAAAVRK